MRKPHVPLALAAFLAAAGSVAIAQHHGAGHGGNHGHAPSHAAPTDTRVLVKFPPVLVEHVLANMRDHLLALQEIQAYLAKGENENAAKVAETRLGMSSLESHGAHDVAKFMPNGMQDAGTAMHRAASKFAIAAQNAGVTGDLRPALGALADVTAQCVGCHAGYKLK
jgi:hypothetical protein